MNTRTPSAWIQRSSKPSISRLWSNTSSSWFSWDFDVMHGSEQVARLSYHWLKEKGVLTIQGEEHRVYREGLMSGSFVLEREGMRLAHADKPSALKRELILNYNGIDYTIRPRGVLSSSFVVLEHDAEVGSVTKDSWFSYRSRVELPVEWEIPVQVFAVWLVVLMWKRESESAAASASG